MHTANESSDLACVVLCQCALAPNFDTHSPFFALCYTLQVGTARAHSRKLLMLSHRTMRKLLAYMRGRRCKWAARQAWRTESN